MTVTFCGHGKEVYSEEMRSKLCGVIESLIEKGADEFLLGGYGNFDLMAAETINKLKEKYPYIKSVLVIPYLNRAYDTDMYDETLYPPIEKIPKRIAIIKRNEYMTDIADVMVACVLYDWGGAVKTLNYAIRQKKEIINIAEI